MTRQRKKTIDIASAIMILVLITLDVVIGKDIFLAHTTMNSARIYFLPVTQGESALLVLSNKVTVLTDAGSGASIVDDLQKILPSVGAPYIDLAIISYPQRAEYEGYQYILDHYHIGAFIYNGRNDDSYKTEWQQLTDAIAEKHIPLITVAAGDLIRYGATDEIKIISPDSAFARSPEPSDTGIVQHVITPQFIALLAADIGTNVEGALIAQRSGGLFGDLRSNILKAPFPGLGAPAGDAFLRAVAPKTIVIAPGVKNTASVPTKAMLAYLASSTTAAIVAIGHVTILLYNE